jgi:hypothetical protein
MIKKIIQGCGRLAGIVAISDGGTLELFMGNRPNKNWEWKKEQIPPPVNLSINLISNEEKMYFVVTFFSSLEMRAI